MDRPAHDVNILLLGGAGETAQVLSLLRARGVSVRVVSNGASHQGVASDLADVTLDRAGIAAALHSGRFTHLLDVSHGFAGQISIDAAAACADAGLPYAMLRRPAWRAQLGDDWTDVPDINAAACAIAPYSSVFTNVGRALLPALCGYQGQLYVRQTTRHDAPPPADNMRFVFGTPPFLHEGEVALLRDLGAEAVLYRNTGGAASETKVTAARALGLAMVMLARPAAPKGMHLPDIAAVSSWLDTL
ncbi:precorrin-6A/cobalt-precorrin-6A reductase [Pseudosulfitobacter koreensis]|uniref:Precorrin-6A/cobalt-precorrin-6A reductase n=1 Tax=Pseudosulfitobacter koreensis TaxID=2968472 RepID=A0ABT1Z4J6_9RHOB|nr:precorrin-6A/cobalt-precorrin-6A reductase [Pseudosulfitobacter koreense]MCR8828061.1 precorrin-6A/cobalt-precorrin-6A reductase [Pseudosulfitobacter koreense]